MADRQRTRNNASDNGSARDKTAQRDRKTLPGDDAVVCKCNNDAIQLTVRKEGPNQGSIRGLEIIA